MMMGKGMGRWREKEWSEGKQQLFLYVLVCVQREEIWLVLTTLEAYSVIFIKEMIPNPLKHHLNQVADIAINNVFVFVFF